MIALVLFCGPASCQARPGFTAILSKFVRVCVVVEVVIVTRMNVRTYTLIYNRCTSSTTICSDFIQRERDAEIGSKFPSFVCARKASFLLCPFSLASTFRSEQSDYDSLRRPSHSSAYAWTDVGNRFKKRLTWGGGGGVTATGVQTCRFDMLQLI